jgi:hypothetical protein
MIKAYLNNRIFWFTNRAAAAVFARDNPSATLQEWRVYWDQYTRQWETTK